MEQHLLAADFELKPFLNSVLTVDATQVREDQMQCVFECFSFSTFPCFSAGDLVRVAGQVPTHFARCQ
jgi:hypothetical protein